MNAQRIVPVLCFSLVAAFSVLIARTFWPTQPSLPPVAVSTPEFLQLCSGMTVTEQTKPVAVANCLGRLSGFVAGHQMTATLAAASGADENGLKLWCFPRPQITDRETYNAVAVWAKANPDRLKEFIDREGSTNTATLMLAIAALHATYPCSK